MLFLSLCSGPCPAGERGVPAREGIGNFGQVDDKVYRGAQPDAFGLHNLKRLGVKLVINLRMPDDVWKQEEAEARVRGILYTNVPLRGLGRPTDEQVSRVLDLIETAPGPVFIHCEHGCDRTGTIIACYRIKHHQWSSKSALAEAELYGLSHFERGMRSFIKDFGKQMGDKDQGQRPKPGDQGQKADSESPKTWAVR